MLRLFLFFWSKHPSTISHKTPCNFHHRTTILFQVSVCLGLTCKKKNNTTTDACFSVLITNENGDSRIVPVSGCGVSSSYVVVYATHLNQRHSGVFVSHATSSSPQPKGGWFAEKNCRSLDSFITWKKKNVFLPWWQWNRRRRRNNGIPGCSCV